MVVIAADLRDALPEDPTRLDAWLPEARRLLAFILAFFTLAVVWVNHSYLTGALEQATRGTMWLNVNVMFWISLFPAAVRLLGGSQPLEFGAIAYGVVLTAMSVSLLSLRAFVRARSRGNASMSALAEISTYRSAAATLICVGSVLMAFLSPYISIACFVVAPALFLFPESRPVRA
jgi:uncharacterized membrane protein